MRARLLALLMTALVAVGWGAPRGLEYLCAMDGGHARARCCCAPPREESRAGAPATIRRAECCEVRRANGPAADARPASPAPELVAIVGFAARPTLERRPRADVHRVLPCARGPPPTSGPPLYLRHATFLI